MISKARLPRYPASAAKVLAAPGARGLALDHDGRQHLIELRDVMLVGPGHNERERNATAVYQQVRLPRSPRILCAATSR